MHLIVVRIVEMKYPVIQLIQVVADMLQSLQLDIEQGTHYLFEESA
jgi:hypothetical protein